MNIRSCGVALILLAACGAAHANDDCVNAQALTFGVPVDGDTTGASYTPTVPPCGGVASGTKDVWYTLSVPVDANITVSTDFPQTNFDATIRVYCAGTCALTEPTDLVCYASGLSPTFGPPSVTFDAAAGDYLINIAGFGETGGAQEGAFRLEATNNGAPIGAPATCGAPCEVDHDPMFATEVDNGCPSVFSFDCGPAQGGVGGDVSNPGGNLIVGTDPGFQGWLFADAGIRDADTWRFEVQGDPQIVAFDGFFETPAIFDIFTCPGRFTVLGGGVLFDADCEPGDLEILLSPGTYTLVVTPFSFFGAICETDNTEYRVALGIASTGACCLGDGTCLDDLTSNACVNENGGVYQGDDSECVGVTCPSPGACCAPDNSCAFVLEAGCIASGGVFQGEGVVCSANTCASPGACCAMDGSCTDVLESDCNSNGGSFQGEGTDCAGVSCVQSGACCAPDGSCRIALEANCTASGGAFQGQGVVCFTPAPSGSTSNSTDTPIAIPENAAGTGVTSTITRSDGIAVGDVVISIDITHPDISDLKIGLLSPSGTPVNVFGDTCAGTANMVATFVSDSGSDAASVCALIPSGAVVNAEDPFTTFAFEDSDGDWDLVVSDSDPPGTGDVGTLNSWRVEIREALNPACGPPSAPCDVDATSGVTVGDLLAFLAAWFAGDPASDFNMNGIPSVGVPTPEINDLLAYLACYFDNT